MQFLCHRGPGEIRLKSETVDDYVPKRLYPYITKINDIDIGGSGKRVKLLWGFRDVEYNRTDWFIVYKLSVYDRAQSRSLTTLMSWLTSVKDSIEYVVVFATCEQKPIDVYSNGWIGLTKLLPLCGGELLLALQDRQKNAVSRALTVADDLMFDHVICLVPDSQFLRDIATGLIDNAVVSGVCRDDLVGLAPSDPILIRLAREYRASKKKYDELFSDDHDSGINLD